MTPALAHAAMTPALAHVASGTPDPGGAAGPCPI
jgi:hypothetical protein